MFTVNESSASLRWDKGLFLALHRMLVSVSKGRLRVRWLDDAVVISEYFGVAFGAVICLMGFSQTWRERAWVKTSEEPNFNYSGHSLVVQPWHGRKNTCNLQIL